MFLSNAWDTGHQAEQKGRAWMGSFRHPLDFLFRGSHSLAVQMVKNLPAVQETQVRSLGQEDPLEKGMATRSSILAWKIPWTESLAGYGPWGCKESDITE